MGRRTPTSTAKLGPLRHLRAKLLDLETFLDSDAALKNGAALVAGTRLAVDLRQRIEELEHPQGSTVEEPVPLADVTPEDLREEIRTLIEHGDQDVREYILDELRRAWPALVVGDVPALDGASTEALLAEVQRRRGLAVVTGGTP